MRKQDSSFYVIFMTGYVLIKVKHFLYSMDKAKSCANMNDMVWLRVWHGRTAIDRVA